MIINIYEIKLYILYEELRYSESQSFTISQSELAGNASADENSMLRQAEPSLSSGDASSDRHIYRSFRARFGHQDRQRIPQTFPPLSAEFGSRCASLVVRFAQDRQPAASNDRWPISPHLQPARA